jgi:hypothetical protein
MTDEEFLTAFERCTLPRVLWTHAAHVRMAWLYLGRLPVGDALDRVRDGIRRYNAANHSDGYHETITVACVALVRARMATAGAGEDFDGFRARNPDLFDRTIALLHRHYDPATLSSAVARHRFVAADREPLLGASTLAHWLRSER